MENENETISKLNVVCIKYYDYINKHIRNPSKKIQIKMLKQNNIDLKYYPLDITCDNLDKKLDNFRDIYIVNI